MTIVLIIMGATSLDGKFIYFQEGVGLSMSRLQARPYFTETVADSFFTEPFSVSSLSACLKYEILTDPAI